MASLCVAAFLAARLVLVAGASLIGRGWDESRDVLDRGGFSEAHAAPDEIVAPRHDPTIETGRVDAGSPRPPEVEAFVAWLLRRLEDIDLPAAG